MLRVLAETDERDVGPFPCGHLADCSDIHLRGEHLVSERRDDGRHHRKPIGALVRDEHPQTFHGWAVCDRRQHTENSRLAQSVLGSCSDFDRGPGERGYAVER